MKSIELFLAVGLATAIGTSANTVNAEEYSSAVTEVNQHEAFILAEGAEGGEGAEGAVDGIEAVEGTG